ncbi:sensor histidine kinase [Lentibacillus saliphilus]|uniref:sensor histidine kinase n=1 Tax=Lentibacillus saliphilus TaxID=2737028 RepID=UPI001C311430|nr:ATP-binding protein [Lentibacillus saliphilus]
MRLINRLLPHSLIGRLTFVNVVVIAGVIIASSWALYNTACFLAEGLGRLDEQRQLMFNRTLLNYLLTFIMTSLIAGGILHFYLTKKLLKPVRQLIASTKQMRAGKFPDPLPVTSQDELGLFVEQYNALIAQIELNETERQKYVQDLSHEFRTPLSNLNGYLKALSKGDIAGDMAMYQALYEESVRLTSMVEQLDRLKEWDHTANRSIMARESATMEDVIKQSVAMFDWKAQEQGITLKVDVADAEMSIHQEGIQQVISNFLDNAIRYYEGNGPVEVIGHPSGKGYRVNVTGPSIDIPADAKQHIFDRFYRVDASRSRETGGSGLGLSIAREIITQHGGEIGVTTYPDSHLTTFWFELPQNVSVD